MNSDIFISYRRKGGRDLARTIEQALKANGYNSIFFDYNSLRDGVFNVQIIEAIEHCKDYLLILSPGALDRCSEEEDWVAKEIRSALRAGCKIIPIIIGEDDFNWPDDLPKDLSVLKYIQFFKLMTNEYFNDSILHLTERLDSKPSQENKNDTAPVADFAFVLHVDETCDLFINDERIRKIRQGKSASIDFLERKKTYHFTIQSLAVKTDIIEYDFTVPEFAKTVDREISFSIMRKRREVTMSEDKKQKEQQKRERERKKETRRILLQSYSFVDEVEVNGRTLVGEKRGSVILYGYVDTNGYEVIPCFYQQAIRFSEGLAAVFDETSWSFINPDGDIVLPKVSDTPGEFRNGVTPFSNDNLFGLLNHSGKVILPCKYELVSEAVNSFVVARMPGGKYYLYGLDGKEYPQSGYDSISLEENCYGPQKSFSDWHIYFPCLIKKHGRFGLLGQDGVPLLPCIADDITDFEFESNSPFLFNYVSIHNQYSFFQFPYCKIMIKGFWGILDLESGHLVVPAKYRTLCPLGDSFLFSEVCELQDYGKEDAFGLMSPEGKIIVPPEFCATFCTWTFEIPVAFKSRDFAGIRHILEKNQDASWRIRRQWDEFLRCIYDEDGHPQSVFQELKGYSFDATIFSHLGDRKIIHFEDNYQPQTIEKNIILNHNPKKGFYVHDVWDYDKSMEFDSFYAKEYWEQGDRLETGHNVPFENRYAIIIKDNHFGLLDAKNLYVILPTIYDKIEWDYYIRAESPHPIVSLGNLRTDLIITVGDKQVEFYIGTAKLKYGPKYLRKLFPFLDIQV